MSKETIGYHDLTTAFQTPNGDPLWMEETAIRMEALLTEQFAGSVLGPSVSANFAAKNFELDLTIQASSDTEAAKQLHAIVTFLEESC